MPRFPTNQIPMLAQLLTDDPDIILDNPVVTEFFNHQPTDPIQQQLAPLLDRHQVEKVGFEQAMADLQQEFQAFMRYQPTLSKSGPEAALAAFTQYKQHGQMPQSRDVGQLDRLGGRDWRHDQPM
jgi:hypothetical protein